MVSFQEYATELFGAVVSGRKPDVNEYREVQDGERVVGVLSDSQLLAIVAVTDDQWAQFLTKWPQEPDDPAELREALEAQAELNALSEVIMVSIKDVMGLSEEPINLRRQGDDLVVVVPARRAVTRRVLIRISIQTPVGGCGDPNCTACRLAAVLRGDPAGS